jgi:hypothetical protein
MDHPFTDEEREEIRRILVECLKELKAEHDRQESEAAALAWNQEEPYRGEY